MRVMPIVIVHGLKVLTENKDSLRGILARVVAGIEELQVTVDGVIVFLQMELMPAEDQPLLVQIMGLERLTDPTSKAHNLLAEAVLVAVQNFIQANATFKTPCIRVLISTVDPSQGCYASNESESKAMH